MNKTKRARPKTLAADGRRGLAAPLPAGHRGQVAIAQRWGVMGASMRVTSVPSETAGFAAVISLFIR